MSTEMIRELNATEVDMVSGALSFGGGFSQNGGISAGISVGISFEDVDFGIGGEFNPLSSITNAIAGLLGSIFG